VSRPLLIAQNLNSSDPGVHAALSGGDASWLRSLARRIAGEGVDLIDCNAGTFAHEEARVLDWMVGQIAPMAGVPLCIDSADPGILAEVGSALPDATLINSIPIDVEWTEEFEKLLSHSSKRLVLSLRRQTELPRESHERSRWAEEGLSMLAQHGVGAERVFIDAIALPWGEDLAAGAPMLDFVREWSRSGTGAGTLIGLGNLGYGHPNPSRIHREWWGRLRDAGISAALVDAFDPVWREDLPPPG
jgi:hypothetical protein